MASGSSGEMGRHLRQLFGAGSVVGLSDGELLERFAASRRDDPRREPAESAFEAIVARHGSAVLSVCRQVLGDDHAAEDAFQATFLVWCGGRTRCGCATAARWARGCTGWPIAPR